MSDLMKHVIGTWIIEKENKKMHHAESHELKDYIRSQDEERQMGQKTAGRFSAGKIRHDLIPEYPIDELAKVYTYGCKKYDADNWRKGLAWKENVISPLKRHLQKWLQGEMLDDESNCHHLAMVMWQCCALMEYERCKLGQDDRNPYDLIRMDGPERNRRIDLWKKLALENKLKEYNGLLEEQTNEIPTSD